MSFLDSEIVSAGDITLGLAIEVWGKEFEEQLKHSLDTEGLSDSQLKQEIRFEVTKEKGGHRFSLYFPDYGNYIDEGVKGAGGARKTTSVFKKTNNRGKLWKQKAPQSRFSFKQGNRPSVKHFAKWAGKKGLNKFAVREAVFRQGIEPKRWFSDIVDTDYTVGLIAILEEYGSKQLELDISKTITGKVNGTN